jgi:bifunctional non-homologous end joining protein LigD
VRIEIPNDVNETDLRVGGKTVHLTNLNKIFFPERGFTKRDMLQYYADVSDVLLPHLKNRAMVMKRYPNGAEGEFFFMKRVPEPHPEWLELCTIPHNSGNIIDFPMVQNLASLLWVVNLGCIDLNQWYAKCDDVQRPDYLHFDLDPTPGAGWEQVRETALLVRDALNMPSYPKTSGSKGMHVYVPIMRGPLQKEVWTFAKAFSKEMEAKHSNVVTAEYRIAKRPANHVLVDYNQNAWGRTLASVYSLRPKPHATASTPLTWKEVEKGCDIEQFRMDNVPRRVQKCGDLFEPMLAKTGRVKLETFL